MSFFRQEVEEGLTTPKRAPAWFSPPPDVVPVVVPLGLVLTRTDDAVIAVPAVQAYPTGLSLMLVARVRQRPGDRGPQRPRPPRAGEPPAGPLLTPRGGSETQGAWDATYWLWPLPPPGRLLVVAEWPALHLSETRAEVDTDPILEAAALAVTLWPDSRRSARPTGTPR